MSLIDTPTRVSVATSEQTEAYRIGVQAMYAF